LKLQTHANEQWRLHQSTWRHHAKCQQTGHSLGTE
jgi:hypothetical protein